MKNEVDANYHLMINNPLNVTNFNKVNHVLVDKTMTLTKSKMIINTLSVRTNIFTLETQLSHAVKDEMLRIFKEEYEQDLDEGGSEDNDEDKEEDKEEEKMKEVQGQVIYISKIN